LEDDFACGSGVKDCAKGEWRMEYRRQVAMRCDGEDFVIAIQPGDEIVFRTKDARALRNLCRRLRWQIAIDTTLSIDDWIWPSPSKPAALEA
jgi:hypothetical protein